ncbi:c-type cytochrome [Flavobacterium microcysteis]|uniref:Cytochrome c n=1 Tax=Flavobacterium microcysteis TaxID=2596891 RepID=A0A501Q5T1_9FLAO|nr:cytochrome c [Flavobacterium microcysteis]TPD67271.1 cytochrome c [Flavobacterium microcysteis]
MKTLAYTCLLILSTCVTKAQNNTSENGKAIFEHKCQRCHGSDGTKGLFGAKNLQISRLENTELVSVISKGRRGMPRWERKLSSTEIESVATYIKSLRK